MLHTIRNHTHFNAHFNTLRYTPSPARLMPWLSGWLLRCWQAQCRQAERPGRIVPRY